MSTSNLFDPNYPAGRFASRAAVANFTAGPSGLPEEVMRQIQHDLLNWNGYGMSIMEMSHRSKEYDHVLVEAQQNLKKVMNIPDSYKILFLQGGGHGEFSAVPLNLLSDKSRKCDYIVTGTWSKKALQEAQRLCDKDAVHVAASTEKDKFLRIPTDEEISHLSEGSKYLYYCSNETINGIEWHRVPAVSPNGPVLVADMSSNFLSRPVPVEKFGLIWAGAQKNAGIAGVTVVIVHESLLNQARPDCPVSLHYKPNIDANSCLNTPPTFSIYVSGLVFKWILQQGGLEEIERRNVQKSNILYSYIESSQGFYVSPVQVESRSRMNVVFRIKAGEALEQKFVKAAEEQGLIGLEGHRSVGGLRASLYNAVSVADVERLVAFMEQFRQENL